ncbi:MAG: hypothetical protein RLZZ116_501 [Planctomycetota bacterium]
MSSSKVPTKATRSRKPSYARALQILRRAEARIQSQIQKLLKESGEALGERRGARTRSHSDLLKLLREAEQRCRRDQLKIMRHEETIRVLKAEKRELAAELKTMREDDEDDGASLGRGIREIVAELRAGRIDDHIRGRKDARTEPYSIEPRSRLR